ncbi:MAG: aldehyde dehydrogenase family protein [Mycobacteriaceae bacterium]|nr:aldehyde dehydrogenase family protein [Mycobacteriaceae bacterium]
MTALLAIDALGPDGDYRTRNRETIATTGGEPVAELSIVPALYVSRCVSTQRKTRPLPLPQRAAALDTAADVFMNTSIAGLDFDSYVNLTCRVSGLPMAAARQGARAVGDALATAFDAVRPAQPAGAAMDWRETCGRNAAAVWARRGEVLTVLAPGNAPGVHGLWPQALALGYRVAVRPSRREPLTAHRLVQALRLAGFRPEDAVYLPTGHAGTDDIIAAADLALVYGGHDVVDRYADDPMVFTNGPGRSKILLTAEQDWRHYLDVIVDSVCSLGGMACVNATAVLFEGDAAALARAIAEKLSAITPLPNTHAEAVLPTMPIEKARSLADYLSAKAAGSVPLLGSEQVVADLGDGYAALRPAVHLLHKPDPEKLNIELPFPCVWVSAWSRDDGLAPLRNSLVINAVTTDDELIDDLVAEPTVTNVYSGHYPTHHTAPGVPHDGFLADFLMRNKGFISDSARVSAARSTDMAERKSAT